MLFSTLIAVQNLVSWIGVSLLRTFVPIVSRVTLLPFQLLRNRFLFEFNFIIIKCGWHTLITIGRTIQCS